MAKSSPGRLSEYLAQDPAAVRVADLGSRDRSGRPGQPPDRDREGGRVETFAVHGPVLVPAARCAVDWQAGRQAGRQVEGATRVILDEIRAMGPQLAELCRKYGIAELSVFGSVARGDAQPGSDVDLLYVRVPGNDLGMSYFALQEDLEKLFGRPVDLVPKEGLHRVIRDQVLSDALVLYAA
jgi:uncharacterized protein